MKKKRKNRTAFWIVLGAIGVVTVGFLIFAVLRAVTALPGRDEQASSTFSSKRDERRERDDAVEDDGAEEVDDQALEAYAEEMKVDAEAFFEEKGQILSGIDAARSDTVQTEATAVEDLVSRGFLAAAVVCEYDMDGTYTQGKAASAGGGDVKPVYQLTYTAPNGDLWMVFSINGAVMANPVTYNLTSGRTGVFLSEKASVMSYDSVSGKFFETIPDPKELVVIVVDRIDAWTLDGMTAAELDRR